MQSTPNFTAHCLSLLWIPRNYSTSRILTSWDWYSGRTVKRAGQTGPAWHWADSCLCYFCLPTLASVAGSLPCSLSLAGATGPGWPGLCFELSRALRNHLMPGPEVGLLSCLWWYLLEEQ